MVEIAKTESAFRPNPQRYQAGENDGSRRRSGGSLRAAERLVPLIPATLIGACAGAWNGTAAAGLAAMLGALLIFGVSGFIERTTVRLAEREGRATEVDTESGVRKATPEALEATSGRAGVILLLAASRFWVALMLLAVALVAIKDHRASLLAGFVAAVVLDSLCRLRAGLAGSMR